MKIIMNDSELRVDCLDLEITKYGQKIKERLYFPKHRSTSLEIIYLKKKHTNLLEAMALSLELDAVTSANSQPVLPSEVNPPAGAAVDAPSAIFYQ